MADTPPPLLTTPLSSLAAWTHHLAHAPVPVLAHTAGEVAQLAQLEDLRGCVDAQMISQAIEADPLMTVRVLAHAGRHRARQQVTDAETITAAVMLMGIGPFFTAFAGMGTVEDRLGDTPGALDGLDRVLRRSRRAGRFALGFANHRMDTDAAAVHTAATLHDFAEMLLWCHAPALAQALATYQPQHPELRSVQAQQTVLHTTLPELEQALMQAWRLPELMIQLTDDGSRHALVAPQRRTVQLAVRLARHSAVDWALPAVQDDLHEIADLLNLSVGAAERLVHDLDG
jgi:HD-like signal output (HDOD) protein